jgi:hypothetical protein
MNPKSRLILALPLAVVLAGCTAGAASQAPVPESAGPVATTSGASAKPVTPVETSTASVVSGSEPVVTADAAGDPRDFDTEKPIEHPAHADIVSLTGSADGDSLVITLEMAGPIPAELDPATTSLRVMFGIRRAGETETKLAARMQSDEGWAPRLFKIDGIDSGEVRPFPGSAEVKGSTITMRIDRSALDDPASVGLGSLATWQAYADASDMTLDIYTIDTAPDDQTIYVDVPLGG